MTEPDRPEHAFTAVDEESDPGYWIDVLDRVRAEPAYAAYKARIGELLRPVAGRSYLDVGCGMGADALELAARFGVEVTGVDLSRTMVEEARRRGLARAAVADAAALSFGESTFDGCWADRTFQHLADPNAALAELVRVVKPGGGIVVADPDYDTQIVDVADQELARRVLRFRADHLLRNGTLAHRMGGVFVAAGLEDITVEVFPIVLRDPTALDNAMGLRSWARTAHERGQLSREDADAWERQLDAAIAEGRFLYSFSVFVTAGSKR
jgi:SAM-dependent methyltransferase